MHNKQFYKFLESQIAAVNNAQSDMDLVDIFNKILTEINGYNIKGLDVTVFNADLELAKQKFNTYDNVLKGFMLVGVEMPPIKDELLYTIRVIQNHTLALSVTFYK